jgi:nitrogen-specific signal transduction histidine kinase
LLRFFAQILPKLELSAAVQRLGLQHALSRGMEGKMAQTKQELVRELNHEIHSPLAAIRNALYLAAIRSSDPATLRYLELADAEISRIAAVLRKVNQTYENKRVQIMIPSIQPLPAA